VNALLQPARLRAALPVLSLLIVVLPMFYLQPQTFSYFGINTLISLAVPIVLATMAAWARFGMSNSAAYCALPVTFAGPSTRLSGCPMTAFMRGLR
jgi:hypothetical protein